MRKELDPSFNERVLSPLLDRTVRIGKKLTPADHGERIRIRLEMAGNPSGWTVDRITSLKFIGFAAALVLSLVVSILFGFGFAPMLAVGVIAALLGYLAPNMYLYQLGYDRTKKMQKSLPDALDLLTISVESQSRLDGDGQQIKGVGEGFLHLLGPVVAQLIQVHVGREIPQQGSDYTDRQRGCEPETEQDRDD